MKPSYDHETLWLKAKLFLNRALDDEPHRSFDEQALWATLALELLAKAALSRFSPVLIAEPNEEGTHILAAVGLAESESFFLSVRAKTVFVRCSRAFKPFNNAKAAKLASARNEYLHGGGMGFGVTPPRQWWPEFWALASILVDAQDKTIEDLVGSSRIDIVAEHLEKNKKYAEDRVQSLMSRATSRYEQRRNGSIPANRLSLWKTADQLKAGMKYEEVSTCPACGESGVLEGEQVENIRVEGPGWVRVGEEDYEFHGRGIGDVLSEYFSCANCQLVLETYELLEAAEMDLAFEVEDEDFVTDEGEQEYGND
ncbi:hypothetical protein AHiyo6_00910 [Arthrobacter sp. Hiyo6]|nr:hypothetical protein AHiyo6_00910 [Arthrobacter sp. Hiyo6]